MRMEPYSVLDGGDGTAVVVPEFSQSTLTRALQEAATAKVGADLSEAEELWLRPRAKSGRVREHTEAGWEAVSGFCGCEEPGWWCEQGDGAVEALVFWFDSRDLFSIEDGAWRDEQ